MKYKLSKPEDFTDVEEYQFKLSHAYSVLYSDFLTFLVTVDTVIDMYNEKPGELMGDNVIGHLGKEIQKFKTS